VLGARVDISASLMDHFRWANGVISSECQSSGGAKFDYEGSLSLSASLFISNSRHNPKRKVSERQLMNSTTYS